MALPPSGAFFKSFKELARKAVVGHHDVTESYAGGGLPSNATAMLSAHPDVSFDRAFSRLKDAVLGDAELSGGIRSRWRTSKTRQRLRSAMGTYYPSRHEEPTAAASIEVAVEPALSAIEGTDGIQSPDPALAPLFGHDGYLRVSGSN